LLGHQGGEEIQDLRSIVGEEPARPDRAGQVEEAGLRVDEPVIAEGGGQLTAEAVLGEVAVGRTTEDDAVAGDDAVGELDLAVLAAAPRLDR
jgi:hypothetical protein